MGCSPMRKSTSSPSSPVSVLEYLATLWGEMLFSSQCPNVSHLLSFTDNTGAEWAARRESPSAMLMQHMTAARSAFLRARNLYARACRVTSSDNVWADDLSRQRFLKVKAEAESMGLHVVELTIPPEWRNTEWLLCIAR